MRQLFLISCSAIRSQFLLAVQDREMKEALAMSRELLEYEPDNKMIKEYHKYIMEYIAQGTLNRGIFLTFTVCMIVVRPTSH